MKALFAVVPIFVASTAFAIPAPDWTRASQLGAVISSPSVHEAMVGRPIDNVKYVGEDTFEVSGEACTVRVSAEPLVPGTSNSSPPTSDAPAGPSNPIEPPGTGTVGPIPMPGAPGEPGGPLPAPPPIDGPQTYNVVVVSVHNCD